MAVGTRSCPRCGKAVVADARFCPNCGATLAFQQPPAPSYTPPPSYPAYQTPYQPAPKKSNTTLIIVVVVIVIVVVGAIVGILALGALFNTVSTSTHSTNLVNALVTVPAAQYEYYQFVVPSGATAVTVSGSFTASGGTGNDIEVLVFDQTNYVNWENGHAASAYYDSGQVTTGTISVNLPGAGTYYLVYNNSFSATSSKNVQTTVNLTYFG
jgi:ribosomal protein S27AE